MKKFYSETDTKRLIEQPLESHRTPFARDLSRLIHSPSFRRLQGKTQLYPGIESDFFRNRLTHSLEVADIAKSITEKINKELFVDKNDPNNRISLDLVDFCSLAHDLGHAPFGHIGEKALDFRMKEYGRFEGNGQTLRILSRIEKKEFTEGGSVLKHGFDKNGIDKRIGLNLTYRSYASVIKYDNCIKSVAVKDYDGVDKGFYESEEKLVNLIKKNVVGKYTLEKGEKLKTIECNIMDLADDISYTTYDLEDALKGNFISPLDLFDTTHHFWMDVIRSVNKSIIKNQKFYPKLKIFALIEGDHEANTNSIIKLISYLLSFFVENGFLPGVDSKHIEKFVSSPEKFENDFKVYIFSLGHNASKLISDNGYIRTLFTTRLVGYFIGSIKFVPHTECLPLSTVYLDEKAFLTMEILKQFNYNSLIKSPRLQIADYRGKEIIDKIFETLFEKGNYNLLPHDLKIIFENGFKKTNHKEKARLICDYVGSMTNKYAIEFYARLTSENAETIFKPY